MEKDNERAEYDFVDKLIGEEVMQAYYAGPFTSRPVVQPHEQAAVKKDRETASALGFNERATELYVKNRLMARRIDEHIRQQERLRIGENLNLIQARNPPQERSGPVIPPEFRTKPIGKGKAAALLGQNSGSSGVAWVNKCIADGTLRCEQQSRQRCVFDIRQFPNTVHGQLRPKPR